ncbi:MAG: 2OG-Fe(II) oxygenase [Crocinitomicaceae bacterium]|nr:2OG-Fe(II) oxygenase [Crocinitomicaceae bacterium]
MESVFDEKIYNEDWLKKTHDEFKSAKGFPHIVIDNFLKSDIADTLYENFPTKEQMRKSYKNLNEQKSEGSGFDQYHPLFAQLKDELRTEKFKAAFSKLTGIDDLILPDDHRGSGVHQGFDGSYLDVHVDFSIHPTLKKHRRLNLLIFLNKDWKEEYGGHCEFWNEDVTEMIGKALPILNRAVIFECSRYSFHGYDTIHVPEGESRKSFYSYFYTDVAPGVKYHDTIFKARPSEGKAKKIKTEVKEGSKNFVKRVLYKMNLKKLFNKYE